VIRDLLKKNPLMADAWGVLANCYHKLGRTKDAIQALLQGDKVQPGNPITLSSLANEYFDLGDLKQARLYAERSVVVNGPPQAHEILAEVALAEKNYDRAEREARVALGNHTNRRKPFLILAQIAKARGDLSGALSQLDAIERMPGEGENEPGERELSNVSYLRGDILARMGKSAEAEAAFRHEIEHFPHNAAAWSALAFLYASEGRSEDARKTLIQMVQVSPQPNAYRAAAKAYRIMGDSASARRLEELARRSGG